VQALSALENGRRTAPYRHTVSLLASALGLSAVDTALLVAAVVRERPPVAGGMVAMLVSVLSVSVALISPPP
jgi:hypothetical protein